MGVAPVMPPHCSERSQDRNGIPRSCVMEAGHEGDHMDWDARTWRPVGVVLRELTTRWGRTHRFSCTPGGSWIATTHDPRAYWRSEVEPTPEQLVSSMLAHGYLPAPDPVESTQWTTTTPTTHR